MNAPADQSQAGLLTLSLLGVFLVATSGYDLLPGMGLFNGKRILETGLLLLIPMVTVLHPGLRAEFGRVLGSIPVWATVALGLAGLAGVLSSLRFEHPAYGLLEVVILVILAICLLATAAARRQAGGFFDRLALGFVCVVGLMAVTTESIAMIASWAMGAEYAFDRMLVRFFHPRFYNQLQTFSIPLIAALPFLFGASRRLKLAAAVLIGLQWMLVLVSGGRGSVIAVLAALTLGALLFPVGRRRWLGLHAAGLVLGGLLFLGVGEVNQAVAPQGGQFVEQSVGRPMAHTTGRTHMWSISWEQALEQPLLGAGPSRFACELRPTAPAHPHSFPFTILGEWGFPAFLLIMSVCAWLGWRLIATSRAALKSQASDSPLAAMLACSIMAGVAHALVSGVLIMPAGQVMTVLVCGWALGRLGSPENMTPRPLPATITLAVAVALAAWVAVFSYGEVRQMDFRTRDTAAHTSLEPRYWQLGHACRYDFGNP
jgi:O-antigen ligase